MSTPPAQLSRVFNFSDFEAVNPNTPKPGPQLDAEFNNTVTTVNQLIARLSEIQRADGRIANGIVDRDALAADLVAILEAVDANLQQAGVSLWNGRAGAVAPQTGDYAASQIIFGSGAGIAATNVQDALEELDADKVGQDAIDGLAPIDHTHPPEDIDNVTAIGAALMTAGTASSAFGIIKQDASPTETGVVLRGTQAQIDQGGADRVPSADQLAASPLSRGFKNKLINGDFQFFQRGAGNNAVFNSPVSGSFTADRTRAFINGVVGTHVHSCLTLTQAERAAIKLLSGSAPTFAYRWNQTVAGSGQTTKFLQTSIEGLQQFEAAKVTVSFVAFTKAGIATLPSVELLGNYGSGGAPSASESFGDVLSNVALNTTPQKFSGTFQVPSFAGKTFGTDGPHTSALALRINYPLNAAADIVIADVQLEFGEVATPFERRPAADVLFDCQRYFFKTFFHNSAPAAGLGNAGNVAWRGITGASIASSSPMYHLPRPMRVQGTMVGFNPQVANAQVRNFNDGVDCTATGLSMFGLDRFDIDYTSNAAAILNDAFGLHVTIDADL